MNNKISEDLTKTKENNFNNQVLHRTNTPTSNTNNKNIKAGFTSTEKKPPVTTLTSNTNKFVSKPSSELESKNITYDQNKELLFSINKSI